MSRPAFLGARQAFNGYGPQYDELPRRKSDRRFGSHGGLAANKPKFAYVMSEFENPTGRTPSQAEREELIDFADALDLPLIEDSPYKMLRYDGTASPALLALASERAGGLNAGRAIYLGTFSKSIAPAFRIGWIVGPAEVVARLALIKQACDIQVSTINQKVMLRVAPAIMLAALRTQMPKGVVRTEPEGGSFVWVNLPPAFDAGALLSLAVVAKTAFVPGAAFFPDRPGANTLRLGFSLNDPAATDEGVARLARVVRERLDR